jgi:oligopeptidase B
MVRKPGWCCSLLALPLVLIGATLLQAQSAPVATKKPHVTEIHGYQVVDDYFWLREKENPEVLSYLAAEEAYANAMEQGQAGLRDSLYAEMRGRIKETDQNVPYPRGGYLYYSRTEEGKQYPIYARRRGSMTAPEQVMLDLNVLGEGRPFISRGAYVPGDDGRMLAYTIDTTGFRQYALYVRDLKSGVVSGPLANRVTSVSWAADGKTLFYTQEDSVTKRSHRFYRHQLGIGKHELMYEEQDELYGIYTYRTRSNGFVLLLIGSATTSEVRYLPANRPGDSLRVVAPRIADQEYYVEHVGNRFYIRTNDNGRTFRLVAAPVQDPGRANWAELIPNRPQTMLEDVDGFSDHLVTTEREDGLVHFRVRNLDAGDPRDVSFPEPTYAAYASDNFEFATPEFRFEYTSLITPTSVYDYSVKTEQRTLLKQQPVLGGYDPANYASERIWATAGDGTKIPISLVYRKALVRNGLRPMLLGGYGSYGAPNDVFFSSNSVSLLDRGMVVATAHVRGGGEMGKPWHDGGRMMTKRNTFDDFIAASEYLVAQGYTSSDRLVITGGSAGGLLMGAVTNMHPDLFRAVVSYVPFVDVMNTMLDASLPLTTGEYLEWGNPNEKAAYDYMVTYSPYDNIAAKAYPAILVRSSFNDSQVMYWEPAKYVAKLRSLKTDSNPLIFKIKLDPGGHGGASGRYDRLHDTAFDYAFILSQLPGPPAVP